MPARESRCPTCKEAAGSPPGNGAWPFCSDRCRLADLGRWLGESYRIPGDRTGDGASVPSDPQEEETG
jgi:uncharacterized protein